ncbi:MAG: hypothetical protein MJ098_07675 [Saccharofermentans sp.]|nr:hypothetical protein [Saccharofermentans sp.]
MSNRISARKSIIGICIAEAMAFFIGFIGISFILNYAEYRDYYFYPVDGTASFDSEINDHDGTAYPAGTVFRVNYITANGYLGIYTYVGEEEIDDKVKEVLGEKAQWQPVSASVRIEDARNSRELTDKWETAKNNSKKEYLISCAKSFGKAVGVFLVACAIFGLINFKLLKEDASRKKLLLVVIPVVLIFSTMAALYLTRLFFLS